MSSQALPGFRDFYPDEFALRAYIFETWRTVASRYGFEEYDGPPLEPLDLYTAKSGDEIVGQLYNFIDKGDRAVALRPEMTPTLARMVAARANGLKKPIRWFSIPQLFRYERQQRGRLREHFQLNCDLIGESSPLADAEVIALAVDVIRAFKLTERDVRARLSDRRVLTALLHKIGVPEPNLPDVFAGIDRISKLKEPEVRWILSGPARGTVEAERRPGVSQLPASVIDRILDVVKLQSVDDILSVLGDDAVVAKPFKETLAALRDMELGQFIDIDLTIVRGLAYYTGTVFELFDAEKTLRAICGGGRYDDLTSAVGGVALPAVGFGFGDVVLGELLKERGVVPPPRSTIDIFIAAITGEDVPPALTLAHALRDAGYRVEYTLSGQAVGKQLKLADSRNARVAVVIGPDDRARGEVMIKDLRAKVQHGVATEAVISAVAAILKESR